MDDKMLTTKLPFKAVCVNTDKDVAEYMDLTAGALHVGRTYTITGRKIRNWKTSVWTEELGPEHRFNSVHFEVVE